MHYPLPPRFGSVNGSLGDEPVGRSDRELVQNVVMTFAPRLINARSAA